MKTAIYAACGLLFACAAAQAQTAAAPAPLPPVAADPQSTSASYGDWVLRCQRLGEPGKERRICEIAQTIQVQGQQTVLAQVAMGRVQPGDPMRLTVVVPSNISLPGFVRIFADDKQAEGFDLAWRRCTPGGCFADAEIKDDMVLKMRARTDKGRLQFKDSTGRDIALPFSLRGLAQALDALAKP